MNCNTQNAKIASITEKSFIVGIDVGSETHYARAFDWRNYEYSKKPLEFSNTEAGFLTFKAWVEDIAEKHGKTALIPGMEPTGHYWFALGKFLQERTHRLCTRAAMLESYLPHPEAITDEQVSVFLKLLFHKDSTRQLMEKVFAGNGTEKEGAE